MLRSCPVNIFGVPFVSKVFFVISVGLLRNRKREVCTVIFAIRGRGCSQNLIFKVEDASIGVIMMTEDLHYSQKKCLSDSTYYF